MDLDLLCVSCQLLIGNLLELYLLKGKVHPNLNIHSPQTGTWGDTPSSEHIVACENLKFASTFFALRTWL